MNAITMTKIEVPVKPGDYKATYVGGVVVDKKLVGNKLVIRMLCYEGSAPETCDFSVRAWKPGGTIGAGGFLGIYQTPSGEVAVTGSCFL